MARAPESQVNKMRIASANMDEQDFIAPVFGGVAFPSNGIQFMAICTTIYCTMF